MNLVRSLASVSGMTLMSRVLGFVRDVLIANFLGAGVYADAWAVAFRFPNLFRRFFGEGAFNSAFVPLFSKRLEGEGQAAALRFAAESQAVLGTALLILSVVVIAFAPWVMIVIAPGFLFAPGEAVSVAGAFARVASGEVPEKYAITVAFTRIAFPYLMFVSLVALLSGILNSLGKFALAAFAPVLLNIILIGALFVLTPFVNSPGHALVWGTFAAGIAQFAVLVWGCRRAGMMPPLRLPRMTPGVRRLITLGIPGVIAGGITQINIVVGTMIATLEDGAAALLYYADRIYQLPLGLIGVAMGVVLLPNLSRRLRAGDEDGAHYALNRGAEIALLLTLPAAAALMVIPVPIIRVLFEHGAFGFDASIGTAAALFHFAWGLPAFVLIKVLQPPFFAREDTRTPMLFGGVQTAVNIVLAIVLFREIGFVGIAIATSAGAWVNAGLLAMRLKQKGLARMDARLVQRLPLIVLSSLIMAVGLYGGALLLEGLWAAGPLIEIAALSGLTLGGMALYGAAAAATGAARPADLKASLKRA